MRWLECNEKRSLAVILCGILGAGCSSIPLFERYEEPYVISRVERPTSSYDSFADRLASTPKATTEAQPVEASSPRDEAPTPTPVATTTEPTADAAAKVGPIATSEPGLKNASVVRARTRPRLVRGDRVPGAPIEDASGNFAGTVRDLLVDPMTGDVIGVVAARFGDDSAKGGRVFDFEKLRWALADIGTSVSVDGAADNVATSEEIRTLFATGERATVEGVVTELRALDSDPSGAILTLRDAENRFHRILLGAADLLSRTLLGLSSGEKVVVEGMLTRDKGGKLWVASALTCGPQTVRLRDDAGDLLWSDLTARFTSTRNVPRSLRSADGVEVPVHGWMLDVDAGSTAWLCVVVDGTLRLLSWDDVEREAAGWTTEHSMDRLESLRRLPVGPRAVAASRGR